MAIDKKDLIDDYLIQRIEQKSTYKDSLKKLAHILSTQNKTEDDF
jgi:flagellum-specific ATP synthase